MDKNWQDEILKTHGVTTLSTTDSIKKVMDGKTTIFCSRCSKTKNHGEGEFTPAELYTSIINQKFYGIMDYNNFDYGIISDKYGIIFKEEKVAPYDMHPSELTPESFKELGKIIGEKARARGYDSIIFYNSSPIMSSPYFKMMKESGLKIYFMTKIDIANFKTNLRKRLF